VPAFLERELGERVFVEQLDLADAEHLLTLGKRYPIRGIVHLAAAPFAGDEPLVYLRRSLDTLFSVLDARAAVGGRPGLLGEHDRRLCRSRRATRSRERGPARAAAGRSGASDPDDQAPVSSSRSLASRWVR
jgi:hypothetical protein